MMNSIIYYFKRFFAVSENSLFKSCSIKYCKEYLKKDNYNEKNQFFLVRYTHALSIAQKNYECVNCTVIAILLVFCHMH